MNTEHPWRDEETLERLYWGEGLNQQEIADRLGCTKRTIAEWMGRHDMESRTGAPRVPYACYHLSTLGYEVWRNGTLPDRNRIVKVHRLLAVAEYGIQAVKDKHVHHKNGIKWDNRPDNIELVSPSEHRKRHPVTARRDDGTAKSVGLVNEQ